jgi:hypothetical protein
MELHNVDPVIIMEWFRSNTEPEDWFIIVLYIITGQCRCEIRTFRFIAHVSISVVYAELYINVRVTSVIRHSNMVNVPYAT